MKRILGLILGVFFCGVVLSLGITQEIPIGKVSGKIVMAENGRPLEGAAIALVRVVSEDEYHRLRGIETNSDGTFSMGLWSSMLLEAAGSDAELVRVADDRLPDDLKPTGVMSQHILARARRTRCWGRPPRIGGPFCRQQLPGTSQIRRPNWTSISAPTIASSPGTERIPLDRSG